MGKNTSRILGAVVVMFMITTCYTLAQEGDTEGSDTKGGKKRKYSSMCAMKGAPMINTAAMKILVNSGVAIKIIDARGKDAFDAESIPGAISLPIKSASDEEIAKVLPNKDDLIITYCAGFSCSVSTKLREKLNDLGYTNVIDYKAGIKGWTGKGAAEGSGKKGSSEMKSCPMTEEGDSEKPTCPMGEDTKKEGSHKKKDFHKKKGSHEDEGSDKKEDAHEDEGAHEDEDAHEDEGSESK